ncbi:MAG: SurA N-terminal domain-containing protein, partial [Planctomycetes bacterium]|nr:SurA N-terminal domain-containing protein [Planctomycetota bacterium]
MASPLELFRKKQKVLMVPLTILAMFAFIVMDQLKPEQIPPILGMLVFGPLFWYLGKDRGKGTQFAVFGIIIGFFVGYMYMPRQGAATVVTSTAGNIDIREYNVLVKNRQIANQFVNRTYYASLPEEEQERAQPPRGALFGFGRNTEDDIILEFLFRKEAEKMNLVVSDETVTQYISRYTNNKLSKNAFQKTCQQMRLTEGQIYDILRDQIQARLAFQMLRPEVSLTPDQYWNFYKKFNVREELELVALPVKAFEDEVTAPTEMEKKVFFENYKSVFRNEKGPGSPGLRQPQKVQVEYLLVDFEETEKLVPPVTDAEIKTFYEDNKERLYKNNPIPDSPDMQAPGGPTLDQPVEAVKPGSSATPEKTDKKPAAPAKPQPTPGQETKPKAAPK